jgi:ribosome-associated heat shock protein Hsp15
MSGVAETTPRPKNYRRPVMRVDLYLQYVRVFKTRSVAAQACQKGNVTINNQVVKPAREVKPGEIIHVSRGDLEMTLRVLDFPLHRLGAPLVPLYMENLTPPENYERAAAARKEREFLTPHERAARPNKKQLRQIRAWAEQDNA